MDFLNSIKELAKGDLKKIVLPEGSEDRTLIAASIINAENIAKVILIGSEKEIHDKAEKLDISVSGIEIQDPDNSVKTEIFAHEFHELRKAKGITEEKAFEMVHDPMYYAAMMVKMNFADGMVSGAVHTTGDLLRPALQIIKTATGSAIVSSFFIMIMKDKSFGEDGLMLFADCAVNPNPNPQELASIAISTAESARKLCGIEPRVAMLSFSTMGSAQHELVEKVRTAAQIARNQRPDLEIEGEMQADAALVDKVAKKKAPGSKVAGNANVLIFPDLQAGNIGYKLVERLAGAMAVGPVCQGFSKPVNDLSRGCSVEDIVNVVAITAVQAQS